MTTSDPHTQKKATDVVILRDFLLAIANSPSLYADSHDLSAALKDQKRTAQLETTFKLDGHEKRTKPMSLNSLKHYANLVLPGGFKELNMLRINAIDAINDYKERKNSPNKRTKSGLQKYISDIEVQLEEQRKINLILLQAVSGAVHAIKTLKATSNESVKEKRAEDAINRLRAIISLNSPPFDRLSDNYNIVSLETYQESNDDA